MSKRPASKVATPRRRKRRWNGVSTSSQTLDLVEPPDLTETMRVWHVNTEDPAAIRMSSAPIPNLQNPTPAPVEQAVQFEEATGATGKPPAPKRKRKNRNDSVSTYPDTPRVSQALLTYPTDENGDLDCAPNEDIGRNHPPRRPSRLQ